MTILELPWPPSVNHYWRHGQGRVFISAEGQRYKLQVAGIIAVAGVRPLDGPVKVTLDAFPPDRRKRDLDNLQKAALDALAQRHSQYGLYFDDAQIKRIESTMHDHDPVRASHITLTVSPWPGAETAGVPVPVQRPSPVLAVARAKKRPSAPCPEPVGEQPCPTPAQRWWSLLATPITRIKAIPRWRPSDAWSPCCAPTTW